MFFFQAQKNYRLCFSPKRWQKIALSFIFFFFTPFFLIILSYAYSSIYNYQSLESLFLFYSQRRSLSFCQSKLFVLKYLFIKEFLKLKAERIKKRERDQAGDEKEKEKENMRFFIFKDLHFKKVNETHVNRSP